jgi:predicted RNase H-like HicB family nuclease
MTMDHAWNERPSTFEQERRFRRLTALHTLTDAWIHAIHPEEESSYRIARMERVTLNQNLWLFEKSRLDALPLRLEHLVGAMEIDAFLDELRDTIWIIQASTIENVLSQREDPAEIATVLQQASWKHGRDYAESIWGTDGGMSRESAFDALMQSHIYEPQSFWLERKSTQEISFLWKKSPYQIGILKTSTALSHLGATHEHWIKGFIYGVSRQTRVITGESRLQESAHPRFILL